MKTREYAAIVLAAGYSSRMGKYKPLLSIGSETLASRVISTFLHNDVEVILVTGWRQEELRGSIDTRDITVVENPDFQKGMFTSVLAGVDRLKATHKAFFILPVDIPLVRPSTINRLIKEADGHPENIIYPVFNTIRGHPPLIPSNLVPAIAGWQRYGGLKAVLNSREEIAREVKVTDSCILLDVDTPQDYEALLERFQHYEIPTDEEQKAIFSLCNVDPDRIRHCLKVAEIAAAIGSSLQACGCRLDLELVRAAAALHDIAKGQPAHDTAGGKLLREMGFAKLGDIAAVHSDLSGGNTNLPLEAKIVFLADKLVQGETPVTLEERYRSTGRRFAVTPEIEALILERREVALRVKLELETLLGRSLEPEAG